MYFTRSPDSTSVTPQFQVTVPHVSPPPPPQIGATTPEGVQVCPICPEPGLVEAKEFNQHLRSHPGFQFECAACKVRKP